MKMTDTTLKSCYSSLLSYLKNWRNLVLIAYLFLVLMSYFIVNVNFYSPSHIYIFSVAELLLITLIFVCPKLLRFTEELLINIEPDVVTLTTSQKKRFFIQAFFVSFFIFFIMYIAYYPGGFSDDQISQYSQAVNSKYDDWHPVLQTLFAFTLPLKLSGGWIGSIILFQIVIFSLALAYTSYTIAEYGYIKYAKFFLFYIMINPVTLGISLFAFKGVSFAIFAMLAMTFAVHIYFSKGQWLNNAFHMVIFLVVIVTATIFRHNAILFTLPLLIAVMLYVSWKKKFLLVAGFLFIIFLVRWPLYSYLKVTEPDLRVVETTGLPMTIIGDAVHETPQNIDKDILDFAYKLVPPEIWEKNYKTGAFASVKYFNFKHLQFIEEAGYAKIFNMMLRCIIQSPIASLKGFCACTDIVYGIAGHIDYPIIPFVSQEGYGIEIKGIPFLQLIFEIYVKLTRGFLKHIFWHVGVLLLVLLVLALIKVNNMQKLFLVLPLFTYDFGTMLFLHANDFRYFYCTYLVAPLVYLVLLLRNKV